jgi:hypothetical protein
MSEYTEAPKKSNMPLIVIIMILLVGVVVLTVMLARTKSQLNDMTNENLTLKADMEMMNEMMAPFIGENVSNNLLKDFNNMLKDYDKIIQEGRPEDQEAMKEQQTKIQGLITELETAKKRGQVNGALIAKLNRENETLRNIMKGYVRQIDELNTKNLQLTSDLDKTSTELTNTKSERDQFKQEAEENAEQVRKGSKLTAFGFSSIGLKMKLNNTTEETNRARNVVQIKSSFTISENPIAKAGNRNVYMQVISPDGKTMQSKGSNVIQTEGGSIPYSDAKEINYNNQRIDVTIYYDLKGETAEKGNYKVKIYCDGSLIGTDSFTLK